MNRVLPAQPNLNFLKNEAKRLHRAHARGDTSVCDLFRHMLRFADVSDAEILEANVSLTDVQYALAMDYGYVSWLALTKAVSRAARIEDIEDVVTSAFNYLIDRRFAAAIEVLSDGHLAEPERVDLLLMLLEIAVHQKDREAFAHWHQRLLRTGDPTALATAEELKAQLRHRKHFININLGGMQRLDANDLKRYRERKQAQEITKIRQHKHIDALNLLDDYYTDEVRTTILGQVFKNIVALDISASSVKLLRIEKHRARFRESLTIAGFASQTLPPGAVEQGDIKDVSAVADAITTILARTQTRSKDTAIALSGTAIMTRFIDMPGNMSEEGRERWLEAREEQFVPLPRREIAMDYRLLDKTDNDHYKALLSACRLHTIDQYVETTNKAGLDLKIIDVRSECMRRAFALFAQEKDLTDKNVAIIEFGARTTTEYILCASGEVRAHESFFGGMQLTEEIKRRYNLSIEEAERLKIAGEGLPDEYQSGVLDPFIAAMAQVASQLVTMDHNKAQADIQIDNILLAGGCALIPGVASYIETKLGIPTEIADFTQLDAVALSSDINEAELKACAPGLLIALGLAMRDRT